LSVGIGARKQCGRISGNDQHRYCWMLASHLHDELATVEFGHHEIRDDKVDGATVVKNSQRLATVARCADEVAESCEESVQ